MDRTGRVLRYTLIAVVGVGFALLVWVSNRADWKTTFITAVSAQSDGVDVFVVVEHSQCRRDPRVQVIRESSEAVRLRATQDEGGDCDGMGHTSELTVRLNTELGARQIEVEEPRTSEGRPSPSCEIDGEPEDRCVVVVP